jgi:hypothetical protein
VIVQFGQPSIEPFHLVVIRLEVCPRDHGRPAEVSQPLKSLWCEIQEPVQSPSRRCSVVHGHE